LQQGKLLEKKVGLPMTKSSLKLANQAAWLDHL